MLIGHRTILSHVNLTVEQIVELSIAGLEQGKIEPVKEVLQTLLIAIRTDPRFALFLTKNRGTPLNEEIK